MKGALSFEDALAKTSREDVNRLDGLGMTALFYAAKRNNEYQLRQLLEKGADPSIRDPLGDNVIWHCLREEDNLGTLRFLHEIGAYFKNVAFNNFSALHQAVNISESCLELCFELCENLDSVDDNGWTPLMTACEVSTESSKHAIKWLLSKGANGELRSLRGYRTIDIATVRNHAASLEELLDYYVATATSIQCTRGLDLMDFAGLASAATLRIFREASLDWTETKEDEWALSLYYAEWRQDWNQDWAVGAGKLPDEDPQAWFAAYMGLYDDVQEQLNLHAASKIMSGELEEPESDEDSEEGEEGDCAQLVPGSFPKED